jgi:hypothetical protein
VSILILEKVFAASWYRRGSTFLAQAEEMGFYPTYHKEQCYKKTSQFTQPQFQSSCPLCHTLRHVNFGKNSILNLKLENVTFVKPASTFNVL